MIPKTTTQSNPWRDLWSSVHREPYTWSSGSGLGQDRHCLRCFFCDHLYPGHTQDCLYRKAASMSILFSSDDDWHTLWQELIELGPWDKTGFCHYCGVPAPGVHDPGCPYLKATVLENEITKSASEKGTQPDLWHRLCQFWETALDNLDDIPGGK